MSILMGNRAKRGAPQRWIRWSLTQETDSCLEWPFGLAGAGYGSVRFGGRTLHAHRLVCILANGDDEREAAHNCGNRKCCNWRHLRFATSLENHKDKIRHGTSPSGEKNPRSKLSAEDVKEIRNSVRGHGDQARLARQMGVSADLVSKIVHGKLWQSFG